MRHAPKPSHQREHLQPRRPCAGRRSTAGFTLIEMLVVVIIIAILVGMIFGLSKLGSNWQAKAATSEKLGRLRAAIEEFNAEYGKYPPVNARGEYDSQLFGYEYACPTGMSASVLQTYFISETNKPWAEGPIFTFGLISFLVTRYAGRAEMLDLTSPYFVHLLANESQWQNYNIDPHSDTERDRNAIVRWSAHLTGVTTDRLKTRRTSLASNPSGSGPTYTNNYLSAYDGWGSEFNYKSDPPYTSYRLWSNGPDGISGTADDLSTSAGN